MPSLLPLLTWALALAGAASALGAALGKGKGLLNARWVNRLYILGYLLMGLSMALFVLWGFLG